MTCTNCGTTVAAGMRFCGACGSPVDESTRVTTLRDTPRPGLGGHEDPTRLAADPETTRVSHEIGAAPYAPDAEATRVSSRSPFDEPRGAPARVEPLRRPDEPSPAHGYREPQYAAPPRPPQPQPWESQPPAHRPQPQPVPRAAGADEAEHIIFSIRPTMLYVGIGYALAALAAVGLTVLLAFYKLLPTDYSFLALLPLLLLLVPAYHHLRRNTIKYTLTDSKIEIDQGLVSRRTRNIPLRNIQDVTVSATIVQRLLGYGDLIVDNANEQGGPTVLARIPQPRRHADLLLRELRRWN